MATVITNNPWLIIFGAFTVIFLLSLSVSRLVYQFTGRLRNVTRIKGMSDNNIMNTDTVTSDPGNIKKWDFILGVFENIGKRFVPSKSSDVSNLKIKYLRAGYRYQNASSVFYGFKMFLTIVFPTFFLISRKLILSPMPQQSIMLIGIMTALIGFYLPDIWLSYKSNKRKEAILKSLPDALDLLVVCVEAGMGLDAAISRVAKETKMSGPELSEELHLTNLEMRAGKKRQDALQNLALRTNLDELQNLTTLLVQTDKFGTSIADALRTYSDYYRTERQQKAEELAAKLPVKLIFPLMFFIFPSLMLAILGPAFIAIYRTLVTTVGQ